MWAVRKLGRAAGSAVLTEYEVAQPLGGGAFDEARLWTQGNRIICLRCGPDPPRRGVRTTRHWARRSTCRHARGLARYLAWRAGFRGKPPQERARRRAANANWAEYVAELRRRTGMSREQLAAAVGVHSFTVGAWERGTSKPNGMSRDALRALAHGMVLESAED